MKSSKYFIGMDIAADEFTVAVGIRPWRILLPPTSFANTLEGFEAFAAWLADHRLSSAHSVLCMEATGVYGEALAYFLVAQGYRVAVEPPLKVKRAFNPSGHKTDP